MTRRFFWFCTSLVLPVSWALGLVWFYLTPPAAELPAEPADAVIILTGGRDRIKSGLDLYRDGKGHTLFISGVHKDVRFEDLFPNASPQEREQLKKTVYLDYDASNTIENAQKVSEWTRHHRIRSLILVTADFHMRRSLLEFHQRLEEVAIYPYPVADVIFERPEGGDKESSPSMQDRKFFLVLKEYHKYLGALARALARKAVLHWRQTP